VLIGTTPDASNEKHIVPVQERLCERDHGISHGSSLDYLAVDEAENPHGTNVDLRARVGDYERPMRRYATSSTMNTTANTTSAMT
jgi:hypothetical protein